MYICPITKRVSAPSDPMHKIVVEIRPVTYTNYNLDGDVIESRGVEIVKEIGCSAEGAKILRERGEVIESAPRVKLRKVRSLAEELAEMELSLVEDGIV